jgi:DnaJ-class molecular chaperone
MANDPYRILGIDRSASDDEVRAAFRRLAKTSHPDLHPGDKSAADRFKKLSAAYDILGDAEKRRQFDAGLIDAAGDPVRGFQHARPGGHPGGHPGAGFGDVFSDFFGEAGWGGGRGGGARPGFRARGQDVRYTLDVEFLEAISGVKKRVTMPDGGVLDLAVPEGVTDGQVLRLKGKGKPGLGGGETGDALVEIHVRPHADYERVGDDVTMTLPISLDEAILGGKVEVATPSGRVQVTLPKGTSSGQIFRLRGKGARAASGTRHGDLLVAVKIVMPDKIDSELSYFISEWRQKHPYDPRGK